jgi:predicted unusual protein kinase regulating ubiquinone biosynthesis (AarF/ABC1/UbiB family)
MKSELPTSSFSRTKTVAKSALTIGAKKAVQFSKRSFLSKEDYIEEQNKTDSEIAQILFDNISLLKGTAVKVAQALALHNILPKHIQQELSRSYNQVIPINQALVMKIIKTELKKHYQNLFLEFDLKPFASASLGQVHIAKTLQKKQVAVKIQYPSIDKTIKSDIKLIKKFTKIKNNILPIIEEVEEKLYEEIDYIKEMHNTIWAHKTFSSDNIIVPKVYKEYSTKHILTTSYIDGLDLYSWLKTNPNKRDKEKIANEIFNLFVDSIFKYKKMQADPNPANFIVTPTIKLALIDFGCMKSITNQFIKEYTEILNIYTSTNKDKVLNLYKTMGFIKDIADIDDELFFQKIVPFHQWAIEPYLQNEYKFTKSYLSKGIQFADFLTKKPFIVLKEFVFLDRATQGLFSLFEQMDVTIDMKRFKKYTKL